MTEAKTRAVAARFILYVQSQGNMQIYHAIMDFIGLSNCGLDKPPR